MLDELDREIRSRERGSIRAVERSLEHGSGWWYHLVKSRNLSVANLAGILDHLGLDPGRFFARAYDTDSDLALDRPRGERPELVTSALERYRARTPGSLGRKDLDALDERRFRRPEEVIDRAVWTLEHLDAELVPRYLGVVGSAWRLVLALDEAEHAIHAGIGLAEESRDLPTLADLLQRLGYVVADRGDYEEALRLAEKAVLLSTRSEDSVGLARALVDQGIWLSRLDRPEEAIATQRMALEGLPACMPRSRCAAFQTIGVCLERLQRPAEALVSLSKAEAFSSDVEPLVAGKIFWLKGKILAALSHLKKAEFCFSKAVGAFREAHLGEQALASCDLARVQLLQNRRSAAYETATSMRALLEPLGHNQVISAAIAELLRCGRAGLTPSLVNQVKAQIEGERLDRQAWLELRVNLP